MSCDLNKLAREWLTGYIGGADDFRNVLAPSLEQLLQRVRNETIDQCAGVIGEDCYKPDIIYDRILKLKSRTPDGEGKQ